MNANPIETVRAVAALIQNPDDTGQVFRLISSLGGTSRRVVRAFARSSSGKALLATRPDIRARLDDREALARLPEGSLGRAYLAFMQSDRLDSGFLVEVDHRENASREHESDEVRWVGERLRDTHDLWHALTGYGGDVLGEAALLAFLFAQTRGGAFGLLASVAFLKSGKEDARRLIVDAFVRGLDAAWLPALPWEELLAEPVSELRARLRVGEPRSYVPISSAEVLAERRAASA